MFDHFKKLYILTDGWHRKFELPLMRQKFFLVDSSDSLQNFKWEGKY